MRTVRRLVHGLRKVAAGLKPFNESVWPGVRNDLFVAHESIYHFFARYAAGKRVLDAGCGTGYGSAILAQSAVSVDGVDIDSFSVRFARRHYGSETVQFTTGDIQNLEIQDAYDLIVSSNALEHLDDPGRFVAGSSRALAANGALIVAVPPIFTEHDRHTHSDIHYHRANLDVGAWANLLRQSFEVDYFAHRAIAGVNPDFSASVTTQLSPADFTFAHVDLALIYAEPAITAVFLCRAPN